MYVPSYTWLKFRWLWRNRQEPTRVILFSAPEPKAQVHYCDHVLFVARRR